MFGDYSKLVLRDFEEKRANKQLPLGLIHLSLAQLRRDCIQICTLRPYERKKDEVGLNGFFGVGYDRAAVLEVINNYAIEKFKPLEYFLKGKTKEPNERVIELLAWMIDFEQRPFELGKVYKKNEEIQEDKKDVLPEEETGNKEIVAAHQMADQGVDDAQEKFLKEEQINGQGQSLRTEIHVTNETGILLGQELGVTKKAPDIISPHVMLLRKIHFKKIVWPVAFMIVLAVFFFLYKKEGCMYWVGDHFERISCNEKINGVLILPVDAVRIRDFKKITQPDTLKKSDINRVFYTKVDGEFEYFTGGGFHPVYLTKSLKPLSEYIYERYIIPLKPQLNNAKNVDDSRVVIRKDSSKNTVRP